MINVRIYCTKNHPEYESTYQVIAGVLAECTVEYTITRINKAEILYRSHIVYQPHIVINHQVVYARGCPKPEDVLLILRKMLLIK